MKIDPQLKGWIKDVGEVVVTLLAIIILSSALLGPKMLIPLVAVTSESMLHKSDSWRAWLLAENVSENTLNSFPMQGGFAMGDMIVTITPNKGGTIHGLFSDTSLGDVVIYNRDRQHNPGAPPIIHRIVGVVEVKDWNITSVNGTLDCLTEDDFRNEYVPNVRGCVLGLQCPYSSYPATGDFRFYVTKGDNNPRSDQCINIALPVTDSQLTARGWFVIPYVGWLKLILNMFIPL
jgi:hypothetical protein